MHRYIAIQDYRYLYFENIGQFFLVEMKQTLDKSSSVNIKQTTTPYRYTFSFNIDHGLDHRKVYRYFVKATYKVENNYNVDIVSKQALRNMDSIHTYIIYFSIKIWWSFEQK